MAAMASSSSSEAWTRDRSVLALVAIARAAGRPGVEHFADELPDRGYLFGGRLGRGCRARPSRRCARRREGRGRRRRWHAGCGRGSSGTRRSSHPRHTGRSISIGMSSTLCIRPIRFSCSSGQTGAEAHAAVPHDDGRRPVPGQQRHQRIPVDLAVVVGIDVDPTQCDQQTVGVDDVGSRRAAPADRQDAADLHEHIRRPARGARAVHDRSALDEHTFPPSRSTLSAPTMGCEGL